MGRKDEGDEPSALGADNESINPWPTTEDVAIEQDVLAHERRSPTDLEKAEYRPHSQSRPASLARTLSRRSAASWPDPGPPPDGGRLAWTQAAMLHLTIFSTFGFTTSFGSFQTYYEDTLGLQSSTLSWLGSLQIFLLYFIGTFSGRAVDAGLFRPVYITGSCMQLIGECANSIS